ncbi:hypothetical protein FN846DRAFT_86117 [Sphaerosporella brunnea]|uniref:Transmembrane protein n=1 Tax=Sphaerosporella brunnea TaxID=1250544 RepID=A0A5J5ESM5_9PEZI|nr:hypothetical protein FN846DRAFT_86117 [Sphaerosporella brunnea]
MEIMHLHRRDYCGVLLFFFFFSFFFLLFCYPFLPRVSDCSRYSAPARRRSAPSSLSLPPHSLVLSLHVRYCISYLTPSTCLSASLFAISLASLSGRSVCKQPAAIDIEGCQREG